MSCAKWITLKWILQRIKLSKLQEPRYNGMSHLSIHALQFLSKYRLIYTVTKEKKPHNMETTTKSVYYVDLMKFEAINVHLGLIWRISSFAWEDYTRWAHQSIYRPGMYLMSLPMNFISMKPPITMARKYPYIMWKWFRIFRPFLDLEEKGIKKRH